MNRLAELLRGNSFLGVAAVALGAVVAVSLRAQPRQANANEAGGGSLFHELHWRCIGPYRGGRTRGVAGVPDEPNLFYMAQVNGGVWKSDDYGRTWNPIFDHEPTQSIGAIAVAPSNPSIIYVASGEGLARPDLSVGDGIYRSDDAGKSWTHLGLQDGEQIPALAVDPRDPNRVFAAVLGHPYGPNKERGLFRSTDGGKTWTNVLYKDENTGASDIEMDPANPDVLYASLWEMRLGPWEDKNEFQGTGGGLFKSTDGGNTWKQLKNGLPKNLAQIYVAIAPSEPSRLYATVGTTEPGDYGSGAGLGVYRSDDAGESWRQITTDPRPAMRIGGGDLPIPKVDPKNPDVVYSTSIVTVRSMDGGKTWMSLRGAPGGDDYQNIWINPLDPDILLLVSDQGAIVSVNRGQTWSSWYNQPTAQLYHAIATTNTFPYRVCAGQQESGSVCISSRGNDGEVTYRDWHPVGAIEYGYVAPDPLDPNIIYGAGRTQVSKYHWDTGQTQDVTPIPVHNAKYRTDRTEPILFSPVDPHVLYYAANVVFETTDGGQKWETISPDLTREKPGAPASVEGMVALDPKAAEQRGAIYAVAASYKNVNTIWAGTDDGLIWVTRDGGKKWSNITPPELTPWSKVTQLEASRFDDDTVYASVSRMRINDMTPYLYRTHDGGKTWQKITNGLPVDSPANTIREDPARKGLLFAGTETGVWYSTDDGDHWQALQLNLPHTSMRDLWIHDNDLIVATHGRAFWILDDITPLREISPEATQSNAFLFQPEQAWRIQRDTYTDTPPPPDEPAGENPPDGAILDYFLKASSPSPVTLEIYDSAGKLVRKYASDDKPELTEAELQEELIPLYWLKPQRILSADEGLHRWVWDLRYPAPESLHHEYPISAVPHDTPRYPVGVAVLPGKYTVKLTAGGKSYTQPLTVKMDPRVKTTPAGLAEQFALATRLASGMNASYDAFEQARSVHAQLDEAAKKAPKGEVSEAIEEMARETSEFDGSAKNPDKKAANESFEKLQGEFAGLYGIVTGADAAPTDASKEAAAEIEKSFAASEKAWKEMKANGIEKLNDKLRGVHLPAIEPSRPIEAAPETQGQDEE
ncbi:MAG TPA: glycoside hydrolase [Verrucomicrobiae bacterium]|nr:glycoside hydrolase [Verrucomicrobiae bacterium]